MIWRDHLPTSPDFDWPELAPGWVWLAGAGPGDPGLVTLNTLAGLKQADAVLYDALVDARILGWVRPGAVVEFAGKRGGRPSPRQRDISGRLVELARQGRRVLRLKGGDPFVFGRGGEEALALVKAGVPFRIVPGVTAGIGGLAYAGIPVTHRDTNHAVTFVTGHDRAGGMPEGLDWPAIARGSPVIVLYMAMKHLDAIAARLIAAGRRADEPVAIVCRASLGDQHVIETTLAGAAAAARDGGAAPPAVICIGEVVRLRPMLDWIGRSADAATGDGRRFA